MDITDDTNSSSQGIISARRVKQGRIQEINVGVYECRQIRPHACTLLLVSSPMSTHLFRLFSKPIVRILRDFDTAFLRPPANLWYGIAVPSVFQYGVYSCVQGHIAVSQLRKRTRDTSLIYPHTSPFTYPYQPSSPSTPHLPGHREALPPH